MSKDTILLRRGLSAPLRLAIGATAAIDLLIGLAFLLGPELSLTLWPTAISPVLMRFIGAIVLANGVGAWLIVRQGTWEGARVLFTVALVYGLAVLLGLLYQLQRGAADPLFWGYVAVDAIFLIPIAWIYCSHEGASRRFP